MSRFVQLSPGDNGNGLPPAILDSHPKDYSPVKVEYDCLTKLLFIYFLLNFQCSGLYRTAWGLPPPADIMQYMRAMQASHMYIGKPTPEEQFASYIRDNKYLEELKTRPALRFKQDYTFRIKMVEEAVLPDDQDLVWRSVRVSGGMPLRAFADKVVLPLIGMCRNYHTYAWISQTPPCAGITPKDSGAIDRVHLHNIGAGWVDDENLRVADLFAPVVGETALFIYDIGDQFTFLFRVDAVATVEESPGSVEVLGGAGPAPPEDSNGLRAKGRFLEDVKNRSVNITKAEAALNYSGEGGLPKRKFTYDFNLDRVKFDVHQALASVASNIKDPKMFAFSTMFPGMPMTSMHAPAKNEKSISTHMGGGTYMTETVNVGKDPRWIAACANCGSPEHLKTCSRCHLKRYCSVECQRAAWPTHKPECKPRDPEAGQKPT